ncbi:hypothetical protein C5167_007249 [Papaver somniferum]|nr:hypothetical protein C5167_007249 [Papaver somniferum]
MITQMWAFMNMPIGSENDFKNITDSNFSRYIEYPRPLFGGEEILELMNTKEVNFFKSLTLQICKGDKAYRRLA